MVAGMCCRCVQILINFTDYNLLQMNGERYPTLRRIAIDYLACQASSVPCERLFSAGGEVATKRRSQLGEARFEKLILMKSAWNNNIGNLAAWNSTKVEEVDDSELLEYKDMLTADRDFEEWDKTVEDEIIIVA
jgi:hypothetical protein